MRLPLPIIYNGPPNNMEENQPSLNIGASPRIRLTKPGPETLNIPPGLHRIYQGRIQGGPHRGGLIGPPRIESLFGDPIYFP